MGVVLRDGMGSIKRWYGCDIKRWYGCGIMRWYGWYYEMVWVVLRDGMGGRGIKRWYGWY